MIALAFLRRPSCCVFLVCFPPISFHFFLFFFLVGGGRRRRRRVVWLDDLLLLDRRRGLGCGIEADAAFRFCFVVVVS